MKNPEVSLLDEFGNSIYENMEILNMKKRFICKT
jgi:hypothetical protein